MLKEQNIQFQIVIFDVEKMVNDERREVQARGIKVGFSYSSYHPLDEVIPVFINLVVLIYAVNLKDQMVHGFIQPPPVGVLPYMGYRGMRSTKRCGFLALLVRNSVAILAFLFSNGI